MTNDKKRTEMKTLIAQAYKNGWSKNELAALLGVSAGAVATYAIGSSMGTNALRAQLAALPPKGEASELITRTVKELEAGLVSMVAKTFEPWMGPGWKVKHENDITTWKARISLLSSIKAGE